MNTTDLQYALTLCEEHEDVQKFVTLLVEKFKDRIEEIAVLNGQYLAVHFKDRNGIDQAVAALIYRDGTLRSDFLQHVTNTIVAGLLVHGGIPNSSFLPSIQ